MVHALTTYPTHRKFSTAITNRLCQKITPQVRRPVIVAVCAHKKQNTCTQQIIYDQQPYIRPHNQAPPINQTTQKDKSSNPNTPTPHKVNHTPTDLQNKNHPKGITNS